MKSYIRDITTKLAFYLEKVGDNLAVIEICDICEKQVSEENGITITASDMNGYKIIGYEPIRCKRKFDIRICDRCIDNIKNYCRKNMESNSVKDTKEFIDDFNKSKVSDSFLNSCKKAGKLFRKR